jgi:hypothetical protein
LLTFSKTEFVIVLLIILTFWTQYTTNISSACCSGALSFAKHYVFLTLRCRIYCLDSFIGTNRQLYNCCFMWWTWEWKPYLLVLERWFFMGQVVLLKNVGCDLFCGQRPLRSQRWYGAASQHVRRLATSSAPL